MATFCTATEQLYELLSALLGHCFSTFYVHGGTPKMYFFLYLYPEEPVTVKTFTGQQKLIARILFVATSEAAIEQYDTSTNTVQSNITLNTN